MTRLESFMCGLLILAGSIPTAAGGIETEKQPRPLNIVIILADDLGYADLGCHGCRDIPTPNIDALAQSGARCTNAYSAAPVGGPSRAALLTGRYPQRFGYEFNPPRDAAVHYGLPLSESTLADRLAQAGYATGLVGKWQQGSDARYHPLRRGFGEFFGFLGGAHYYLTSAPSARGVADSTPWPPAILRGNEPVAEKQHLTDAFTREAVAFIDRNQKKPFFLLLAYNAPHAPLDASDKHLERVIGWTSGDHRRRVYAAMIAAVDDGVGAVMKKLQAAGIDNETLVFFLGDNGGITGYLSPSSNHPLSGTKTELLEGGIRVPFLVRSPGRIPAGLVYELPVSLLDVAPTALAAARISALPDRTIDGVDLFPALSGRSAVAPHSRLYWRYGTQNAIREGRYKLLQLGDEPAQLYDLLTDQGETHDLSGDHSELVERLRADWRKWNAELVPPAWNKPLSVPWW
ncbi:MAG: sulfatase-like hydrolase/transferase [Planctomycetaceae bacterium]